MSGVFFFDDEHFILKNQLVHSLAHIGELYKTAVTSGVVSGGNFYRPNQQVVFSLLYAVFGVETSVPYHLVVLFFHCTCGVLLFYWLRLLQLAVPAALLGTSIFLCHPVQTEAVCYISGLADSMNLSFVLAALVLYTRSLVAGHERPKLGLFLLFALLCSLAMFSKENSVVLAPLTAAVTGYHCIMVRRWPNMHERAALVFFGLMASITLMLKMTVFNFGSVAGLSEAQNVYTESLSLRLKTFVSVILEYASLILWPEHLFYEKPYTAFADLTTERGIFGGCCLAASLLLILSAKYWPRLSLGVVCFWAGLLPFTGIIPLNGMFLEHWLYVPMVGLALVCATFSQWATQMLKVSWERASEKSSMFVRLAVEAASGFGVAALAVIFCAMATRTFMRAKEWASPEAFYLNEIAEGAKSPRIYNNLGMYYADLQEVNKAISYYQQAVDITGARPTPEPHHNLAMAYLAAGKLPEAIEQFHMALKINPQFSYSLMALQQFFVTVHLGDKAQLVGAALEQVKRGQSYDFSTLESALSGH